MMEKSVQPSVASMNSAKQALEAISCVKRKIGEDILPKEWVQAVGSLGIRIKTGSLEELSSQQDAVISKLEKFIAQL
jgi:DNA-binding transcriptional regulator WhiA